MVGIEFFHFNGSIFSLVRCIDCLCPKVLSKFRYMYKKKTEHPTPKTDDIYLQGVPKTRMFITQIMQLIRRQSQTLIPLPSLPASILSSQAQEQHRAADGRQHIEREADAETRRVPGRFGGNEHVGGDQRSAIAAADLERGADDSFIARAQVVHVPHHQDRHRDVYACGDGEQAEIAGAHWVGLGEFNDPADCGEGGTQHGECVTVGYPVAEPCDGD